MAVTPDERGSSIIFVASSLLLIMGMAAMALDGGALYSERRSAQNAADHAALTAAYTECDGGTEAASIVAGMAAADANGFDNDGTTNTVVIVRLNDFQYRATISTSNPTSFAGAIGIEQLTTGAVAVASCQPGELEGEALFAYGSTCDDELILKGNGLEVDGAAHSNGDVEMTGENHEIADGIGHGDEFKDSGSTSIYTASPASSSRPYPIEFDIIDYRSGGSVAVDAGSQYFEVDSGIPEGTWEAGPQKWSVANTALRPGIYYSPGSIEVGQGVTVDSASGGWLDGVTFVAEGTITFKDPATFTAWGGESNKGLVVFSNHPGSASCTEIAIEMQGNKNVFNGIIFAPHGQVKAQGNNDSSFGGIWGYRVSVDGNGLSLEGPTVGSGGDPTVTFDE